jgi:hypothetical protein
MCYKPEQTAGGKKQSPFFFGVGGGGGGGGPQKVEYIFHAHKDIVYRSK